jgi:hypothetical protein
MDLFGNDPARNLSRPKLTFDLPRLNASATTLRHRDGCEIRRQGRSYFRNEFFCESVGETTRAGDPVRVVRLVPNSQTLSKLS